MWSILSSSLTPRCLKMMMTMKSVVHYMLS
ncbi:hypothetical protein E2C01_059945 [Portunus trituberculatus]|uniref:Uncharacterized protein n=1 Tax=Portunus trituberculatus TaxID=210409 RepID=A0A5B7H7K5_PORTR|nr:hypothetical protein [Portunus trituberculatus]